MFSIGALSKRTGVKISTIRYYEHIGLIRPADRTEGNQRRYNDDAIQRLGFIKHARELGFCIEAIAALIELHNHPHRNCADATRIAREQLVDVRTRIASLVKLELELERISDGCDGAGVADDCYVLASLADHGLCETNH